MKILQINVFNYKKGGSEAVYFNTMELLKQHGDKVSNFALKWPENDYSEYEAYFPESKETRKGVFKPIKNIINYFYNREAVWRLEQLIEVEKPDIAQIHLIWGQITGSILPVLKKHNIPVILGLLGIWYNNFFNLRNYVVVPYDEYLKYVPAYLQQLEMESNGKFVSNHDEYVKYVTAPVLFGGAGTNVQHSFFQLLHQGTTIVPCDFIIPAISHNEIGEHHEILVANVLAQGEALMRGKTVKEAAEELARAGKSKEEIKFLKKYKSFPGNRPSNTIVFKKIDPYALGMLIAMYEHKVFVQGVIWDIDSFDQMGVELGKQMALSILPELQGNAYSMGHDSSTAGLIKHIKKLRK